MDSDDEVVLAPAFGLLVVVLRHQLGHSLEELAGEGGPVGGGGESHPAVHGERRELLLHPGGAGDQVTDIADQLWRRLARAGWAKGWYTTSSTAAGAGR